MDEPPYQEISGDQISSMLLNLKKIVIGWQGAINNKQPPILYPSDKFYFWADAYDEDANIMEEVAVFWECIPAEAATLLPIDHLVAVGCKAAHAVYFLPNQYTGKCKLVTFILDSKKNRIESSIEVQIMEKKPALTTEISKVIGSPRDEPPIRNETINIKKDTTIIDVAPTQIVPVNNSLAPMSESQQSQSQSQDQDEFERKFTHSTLTQTSIEERRRQQHHLLTQQSQKSFFTRSLEMTDPSTNKDSWAGMMAYICFAAAFTYLEKENYQLGALFLICFIIFAFAKQGLPEGPFTQWLKNRSKVTISEARKTIIGDK